jgi:hypothetical protein
MIKNPRIIGVIRKEHKENCGKPSVFVKGCQETCFIGQSLMDCLDAAIVRQQFKGHRAIAQLASALAWGARGPGFKSQ